MEIISILEDKRIKALNILTEFTIEEYLVKAQKIISNNPFQRKRVKSSSTVYSLLRDDLKQGCIIPPIVLALGKDYFNEEIKKSDKTSIHSFLQKHIEDSLILDGLQRTYNIIDADNELLASGDEDGLKDYRSNKIRCEFYLGIDKIGILYRMLTLNTGQTPMSLRHQIEILYSDYLKEDLNGIRLIREIDDRAPEKIGEYSFKEIIEGFTSYLLRDYLTFDRSDILENIKSLEKLSTENQGVDIFKSFLKIYHLLQLKFQSLAGKWVYQDEESGYTLSAPPFGKNSQAIFNKAQVMTGLGAAIGFLKDRELSDLNIVESDIEKIKFDKSVEEALYDIIYKLDDIRKNAPKIGNAQRAFFYYYFRELFNPEGDSYLIIDQAIDNGYKRYRQNV